MNQSKELKEAYERMRKEIFEELKFTLQFALSHHHVKEAVITDFPPQFEQLRKQMVQSFWAMLPLRICVFLDSDKQNACSLDKFVSRAFNLGIIDQAKKDELETRIEALRNTETVKNAVSLRDSVVAHTDKKKPLSAKMVISPVLQEIEAIFVEAGGDKLDEADLNSKLGDTWSCLFDLARIGLAHPEDWE